MNLDSRMWLVSNYTEHFLSELYIFIIVILFLATLKDFCYIKCYASEKRIKTTSSIRSKGKTINIILCFYNSCVFVFLFLNLSLSENKIV